MKATFYPAPEGSGAIDAVLVELADGELLGSEIGPALVSVPASDEVPEYRELVAKGIPFADAPPPVAPPVQVYKASMFRKMTDAEYDTYLQIRASFPPRLQAIFDAAEYLSSDDEFWPDLLTAAEQAYGPERAAELLAPNA